MAFFKIIVFFALLLVISACESFNKTEVDMAELLLKGEFEKAENELQDLINVSEGSKKKDFEIELETINRIRKEFPYYRADVKKQLEKYYPKLSDAQLDEWEKSNQMEMRFIDGEKRYFKRSVSNFFRLNSEAKVLKDSISGVPYDGVDDFQVKVVPGYFEEQPEPGVPFDIHRIRVNYTIRLKPNALPHGKIVKCWLPYPRTGSNRLPNAKFMSASEKDFIVSPNKTMQRSVYMEKPAQKDIETVFKISYVLHTAAQWFNVKPEQALPYDKSADLYRKYTAERLPNITFNNEIIALASEIVSDETNPVKQVELLFYWIHKNITWTGALEYSTMLSIPAYVLENRRGDCGMKTFLFLSMARSLGIPCKWQSGWYLLPQEKNLHDWAEVYYEGIGWVPVDPSFGLINSNKKHIREFYLNGMDSYRLVVNDDYAQELFPIKKHYRSEPFDFQRGELEWEGGNLYFDSWSYNMEVEYLD